MLLPTSNQGVSGNGNDLLAESSTQRSNVADSRQNMEIDAQSGDEAMSLSEHDKQGPAACEFYIQFRFCTNIQVFLLYNVNVLFFITLHEANSTANDSMVGPNDISTIGADWKKQLFTKKTFPKDKSNRSFQPRWIDTFGWIEYSENLDAVFCYPCRQFGSSSSKDDVFTKSGFKSWKSALQKGKGFDQHARSTLHINHTLSWNEKLDRQKKSMEIGQILTNDVVEKRRYYVKAIIGVIKFLVSNELALRRDYDSDTHSELGLFTSLFQYTLQKDDKLQACLSVIPGNASYTSPDIQNEIIGIMADMVRNKIVEQVNSSDYFMLLADGMKDKNKNEIISIGLRYIKGR